MRRLPAVAWAVAGTLLLAHLLTLTRYGIFRDELYYVANGRHLAWGYVDHPPLVALIAWATEHTIGTSVAALRVPMLLALAGVLAVIAALVRHMGGRGPATVVAWIAFALSPYYLFGFHYLSMNAPEVLWWPLAALLLARAARWFDEPDRDDAPAGAMPWLLLGLVMGLATLTKLSGLVWGVALAAALAATPARRVVATRWPWVAVAVALALFAPHVAWQVHHGVPTAEFVSHAQAHKITAFAPHAFLAEQLKLLGPVGAVVVVTGLVASVSGRVPGGRAWAVMFLVPLVVFLVQRAKPYYLTPAYPVLLAAGAVLVERWAPWRTVAGRIVSIALIGGGALLVPLGLPVLPVPTLQAYLATLGIGIASGERHEQGALPQHFADMFGWDTLADDVARVVGTLTPDEQARTRIYAQNYGEAGALEYFGGPRGLPPVISGHNAYWYWGPGPETPDGIVIIVGGREEDHRRAFADVREAGRTTCALCMPYEQDLPIFVARGLRQPLDAIWPAVRHFD